MAIHVKPLTPQETTHLYHLLENNLEDEAKKRLLIVLYSNKGFKAPDITPKVNIHPKTIRKWINIFNKEGFQALIKRNNSGGAPATFSEEIRHEVVKIATSKPTDLGQAFTSWSLFKLKEYLSDKKKLSISHESIRQILLKEGISFKKAKTWMEPNDPEFEVKKTEYLTSTKIRPKTVSFSASTSSAQLK